ncbi:MAG: trehalose-phosphatase [Candidatus Altiarchaeales archaeon]|nr:trehalose-phosphatase [Candidatus Altiarchaeales archaeon]
MLKTRQRKKIAENWRSARKRFLFLDYDGTLTPIVSTPDKAVLPKENREILEEIAGKKDTVTSIVSGRMLEEIKRLVSLENIYYVGDHGLNITGPSFNWTHPKASEAAEEVRGAEKRLTEKLAHIEGVLIEDKKTSLVVHYRNAADKENQIRQVFEEVACQAVNLKKQENKKTLELVLAEDWGKAEAMKKILEKENYLDGDFILYAGDDNTDEKAFPKLPEEAHTFAINRPQTSAKYMIDTIEELRDLLGKLSE